MVGTLGASVFMVGLIEGLAESTALIVKVFSGALSDYLAHLCHFFDRFPISHPANPHGCWACLKK
jgi:hypothetical protein